MDTYMYQLILTDKHVQSNKLDIPVNFKETFNIKFLYWAYLSINGEDYKIYLSEKGYDFYEMRPSRFVSKDFKSGDKLTIIIKPQQPIYYKKSPYTYENPVRIIDSINYIKEPTGYLCGQSCVAMLASKPVDEVIELMCTDKGTHIFHIKTALEYYGIKHAKSLKKYKEGATLPDICILELELPSYKHWSLYFKGKYFDPEFGILDNCINDSRILRFLEIT